MSFFNDYSRNQIYEEMEGKSNTNNNSGLNIFSKLLSIVLLLSLGFASGSLYSNSQNVSNTVNGENNGPVIQTVANTSTSYAVQKSDISSIVENCADSVVEITIATQSTVYGYSYTSEGNGSGVIISKDGYILTNNHVISGANDISVRLKDGTEYKATLVGKDSKTDIAIIKIDAQNLNAALLGNSDNLVVGELAVAIGNPLGKLGGTVTNGIISALEREITLEGVTRNLIQTNAAINPGNSGGGLFNSNGELIGVVVAKSTGFDVEGLGFAIPINDVKIVISDLLEHGYATNRAFLGVSLKDVAYSMNNGMSIFSMFLTPTNYGAQVDQVIENSPASKAGIKSNDIIISINNEMVTSASDVTAKISNFEIGTKITVGVIRNNTMMNFDVTLEEYKGQ